MAFLIAMLVGLLAGCTDAPADPDPDGYTSGGRYVAMGDSYTAAPYLPDVSQDGCHRSDQNYPSLLARELRVDALVDVSCGGASTEDVFGPQMTNQGTRVPPQLHAVLAGTDLVTIGLGANDHGVSGLLLGACPLGAPTCVSDQRTRKAIDRLEPRLVEVVTAVREAAPDATVLLVGYPRLAPVHARDCPQFPNLTEQHVRVMEKLTVGLNQAVEAAAESTGAGFIDVYAHAEGHELCSDDPWINATGGRSHAAAPMHPLPQEQRAVAQLIARHLRAS